MDDKVIELLVDKIDRVETKVDAFGEKIDALMEWRWSVYGKSAMLGGIAGVVLSIVTSVITAFVMKKIGG